MADPIALRIVQAVKTRARKILRANGYYTDFGNRITLGRHELTAEDMPALMIFSSVEDSEPKSYPRRQNTISIHLEAQDTYCPLSGDDDEQSEVKAQRMIADVKKAVDSATDRTLKEETGANLARFFTYRGRVIGYPEKGQRIVSARLDFTATFFEVAGSPETSR